MVVDYPAVLDFWFSEEARPLWFRSTPAFDAAIRNRFEASWQAGCAGRLAPWEEVPRGALALAILLDQFPLNMYRGEGRAFSSEALAREVAGRAIDRGWDEGLAGAERLFLYLPFMHSESLADQDRSVALFETAGLADNLRFARHHRELVRRFGRFPHRNAALGRASSAEELEYLASKEAFLG